MNITEEEQPRGRCSCGGVDELDLGQIPNEMPSYCGGYLYLQRTWSSSQILSGKGANNGHFERGHLVQVILTRGGLRLPKALVMRPSWAPR